MRLYFFIADGDGMFLRVWEEGGALVVCAQTDVHVGRAMLGSGGVLV